MLARTSLLWAVLSAGCGIAVADNVFYMYDGNVHPTDPSEGWVPGSPCEYPCSESLENGHLVFRWPQAGDIVYYDYTIAEPPEEPPPTLWLEWRFRSNHPLGPYFYTCDASFTIKYGEVWDSALMYGDAAISKSGDDVVTGLELGEFHTYRFESLDQVNYRIAVDGQVFMVYDDNSGNGYHYVQLGGTGGCIGDQIPNMINEWDFVRMGTIDFGEQIVASDPPAGFLDPERYADLERFTVTFDSANYVYLDEITVEVTGGDPPVVLQTLRREGDGPETVEIVLDRPMAVGETTRFTFDDGVAVNVIEYTLAPNIPAVSSWGLAALALLVLSAGSAVLSRRRRAAAAR